MKYPKRILEDKTVGSITEFDVNDSRKVVMYCDPKNNWDILTELHDTVGGEWKCVREQRFSIGPMLHFKEKVTAESIIKELLEDHEERKAFEKKVNSIVNDILN